MSSRVDTQQLIDALKWRYATKEFDSKRKIDAPLWQTLEEALVLTPSSFGMQPWKFFVVTDEATKQRLLEHSWNQRQVVDCSHHVVFALKTQVGEAEAKEYIQDIYQKRSLPAGSLDGFEKVLMGFLNQPKDKFSVEEWARRQVYIALGNFMTSAALVGVDACPMEGIIPSKYDEVLGLGAKGYKTVVACAAGYRAASDKYASAAKIRFPKNKIVEHIQARRLLYARYRQSQ